MDCPVKSDNTAPVESVDDRRDSERAYAGCLCAARRIGWADDVHVHVLPADLTGPFRAGAYASISVIVPANAAAPEGWTKNAYD